MTVINNVYNSRCKTDIAVILHVEFNSTFLLFMMIEDPNMTQLCRNVLLEQ
jgi:hypothetical protein